MPNHFHGIVVLWESTRGDLIRRDLINQIPTGDSSIPPINQIPTGDSPIPPINQIPTGDSSILPINQTPTGHSPIPTGLNESRFGSIPHWQQMKNPKRTLGKIIRHFKAKAAKKIHDAGFTGFQWQSKYHDRIIRNEDELDRIRLYIRNNPLNWHDDEENPAVQSDS